MEFSRHPSTSCRFSPNNIIKSSTIRQQLKHFDCMINDHRWTTNLFIGQSLKYKYKQTYLETSTRAIHHSPHLTQSECYWTPPQNIVAGELIVLDMKLYHHTFLSISVILGWIPTFKSILLRLITNGEIMEIKSPLHGACGCVKFSVINPIKYDPSTNIVNSFNDWKGWKSATQSDQVLLTKYRNWRVDLPQLCTE